MTVVPSFGRVFFGPTGEEVQFTADPDTLTIVSPKRHSTHAGVGGVVTIQDFGRRIKDATVRLEGEFIDDELVRTFQTMFDAPAAVYHYTDWAGNDFMVFFTEFEPTPHFYQVFPPTGGAPGGASKYRIGLRVMSAAKLWNQAYGGA